MQETTLLAVFYNHFESTLVVGPVLAIYHPAALNKRGRDSPNGSGVVVTTATRIVGRSQHGDLTFMEKLV